SAASTTCRRSSFTCTTCRSAASSVSASRPPSRPVPPSATPSSTPSAPGCRTRRLLPIKCWPRWPRSRKEGKHEKLHLLPAHLGRTSRRHAGRQLGHDGNAPRRAHPPPPTQRVHHPTHQ